MLSALCSMLSVLSAACVNIIYKRKRAHSTTRYLQSMAAAAKDEQGERERERERDANNHGSNPEWRERERREARESERIRRRFGPLGIAVIGL